MPEDSEERRTNTETAGGADLSELETNRPFRALRFVNSRPADADNMWAQSFLVFSGAHIHMSHTTSLVVYRHLCCNCCFCACDKMWLLAWGAILSDNDATAHLFVSPTCYPPRIFTLHSQIHVECKICNQKCQQLLSFHHLCNQLPVTPLWPQPYLPTAVLLISRTYTKIRTFIYMGLQIHTFA